MSRSRMLWLTDRGEDASIAMYENAKALAKLIVGWKRNYRSIYKISLFYGFRLF